MALKAFIGGDRRKRGPSRATEIRLAASRKKEREREIEVCDISSKSLLWECDEELAIGAKIEVIFPDGRAEAKVSGVDGRQFTCAFERPVPEAWLHAPPMRQFHADRRDRRNASANGETLGARIRRLRLDRGLTQAALSQRLGISIPAVCGWEIDRTRPHPNRLAMLADVLGVSGAELLGAEGGRREGKPSELEEQVAKARAAIAIAAGTTPDRVSIYIEW